MPTQLQTFSDPSTAKAVDNYAKSYVSFTSDLITSTMDSLVDAHLEQMDSYQEFFKAVSQDLSSYINNTKDDISTDEILNFIETLDLQKLTLLGQDAKGEDTYLELNENNELVEVDSENNVILRNDDGEIDDTAGKGFAERLFSGVFGGAASAVLNTAGTVIKNVDLPEDTKFGEIFNDIQNVVKPDGSYTYPSDTNIRETINLSFMDAMSMRVAETNFNKLKDMMEMGLLQIVINGGHIKTGFKLKVSETDKYDFKKKDVVRDKEKTKEKVRTKNKIGMLPFFKRKQNRKYKQKTNHFEVHKTKVNVKETSKASVAYNAEVKIDFSSNYKKLND